MSVSPNVIPYLYNKLPWRRQLLCLSLWLSTWACCACLETPEQDKPCHIHSALQWDMFKDIWQKSPHRPYLSNFCPVAIFHFLGIWDLKLTAATQAMQENLFKGNNYSQRHPINHQPAMQSLSSNLKQSQLFCPHTLNFVSSSTGVKTNVLEMRLILDGLNTTCTGRSCF